MDPALMAGSFFDYFLGKTANSYETERKYSGNPLLFNGIFCALKPALPPLIGGVCGRQVSPHYQANNMGCG